VSDKSENSYFPERLRAIREKRGYSQHELARLCEFGANQISRYETGTHDPSATALKTLAHILGVSMDYLAGITDNPDAHILTSDLNVYEREMVETYRREGWPGVFRLGAERISK